MGDIHENGPHPHDSITAEAAFTAAQYAAAQAADDAPAPVAGLSAEEALVEIEEIERIEVFTERSEVEVADARVEQFVHELHEVHSESEAHVLSGSSPIWVQAGNHEAMVVDSDTPVADHAIDSAPISAANPAALLEATHELAQHDDEQLQVIVPQGSKAAPAKQRKKSLLLGDEAEEEESEGRRRDRLIGEQGRYIIPAHSQAAVLMSVPMTRAARSNDVRVQRSKKSAQPKRRKRHDAD